MPFCDAIYEYLLNNLILLSLNFHEIHVDGVYCKFIYWKHIKWLGIYTGSKAIELSLQPALDSAESQKVR